jgi:hypothetical protein
MKLSRVDRNHEALAGRLYAKTAEIEHDHGIAAHLVLDAGDRANEVVTVRIFQQIDVKTVVAERRRQRARVVDRLDQRRVGVGIMRVRDQERDPVGLGAD